MREYDDGLDCCRGVRNGLLFMAFASLMIGGCISAGCNKIKDLQDSIPDTLPSPLPTTTTTTIPPVTPPASQDFDEASMGFTHPAEITHTIKFERINANNIWWSGENTDWPIGSEPTCNGEAHAYVKRDGKWVGGKYDHVRPNTKQRDFKNIHNGYQIWATLKPIRGEIVAFMSISYDKTKRTNAIFAKWE
jgi:hypothetical protein